MQTLSADEIGKSYRGRRVVNGVSSTRKTGRSSRSSGPQRRRKNDQFLHIVGLIPADTGGVVINDQDITDVPMYLRARNFGISYLPQEPSIFRKLTVEDNILAVLEAQPISWHERRERMERLIDQLGWAYPQEHGYALSGGERRRLRSRVACVSRRRSSSRRAILRDRSHRGARSAEDYF